MESFPFAVSGILIVILFTSFVKIATMLSILRQGIGLGLGVGIAFSALAFVLSALIVEPQLEKYGGLQGLLQPVAGKNIEIEQNFSPFLERNSDAAILKRLDSIADRVHAKDEPANDSSKQKQESRSLALLTSAFLISELREAFQLGLLLLLPFVVIDILVANLLMALSVTQISQQVVSLPLKILLFVAVDGWTLLIDRVLGGYQ